LNQRSLFPKAAANMHSALWSNPADSKNGTVQSTHPYPSSTGSLPRTWES